MQSEAVQVNAICTPHSHVQVQALYKKTDVQSLARSCHVVIFHQMLPLTHEDLKIDEFYTPANPSLDEFFAFKTKKRPELALVINFKKTTCTTQKLFVAGKKNNRF